MRRLLAFVMSSGLLVVCSNVETARAQDADTLLAPRIADRKVAVDDVATQNGVTSGVLVNHNTRAIKDVKLIVQYRYQWPDEWKPGSHSPGRADQFTLQGTVAPGASFPFTVPGLAPATPASGGHFDTVVRVLSFDEVIPPAT
jgi:hypothetical protein